MVWLRADPGLLARRVGKGDGRPLLDGDPAARLVDLDEVRRPLYEAVAAAVIDVDGLTPARWSTGSWPSRRWSRGGIGPVRDR